MLSAPDADLVELFVGFFRDNMWVCGEESRKEGVLGDTSRLARKKVPKFPVFKRTSPVGSGIF